MWGSGTIPIRSGRHFMQFLAINGPRALTPSSASVAVVAALDLETKKHAKKLRKKNAKKPRKIQYRIILNKVHEA